MYYLQKEVWISAAHDLLLNYDSPCKHLHGHNWKVTVFCKSEDVDKNGMIVDFKAIKNIVNTLDHAYLNKFIPQPTAENIAKFLLDSILHCYRVEVQESEGSMVAYEV